MYLDKFRKYLTTEKQFKESTIHRYLHATQNFLDQCEPGQKNLSEDINRYLVNALEKYEPSTINTDLSALKTFVSFLMDVFPEDFSTYDMRRFPRKRNYDPLPKSLNEYQVKQILLVLKNDVYFDDPLNEFIFRLMLNHGMTPKEMLGMKIANIDFQKGMVIYQRESEDFLRMMVLIKSDFQCFIEYLNSSDYDLNNDALLQNGKKDLSKSKIYEVCKELQRRANIKINPTLLRNTLIKECLENGMSEIYVQLYMGFKSIISVQRYQRINFKRMQQEALPYIDRLRGEIEEDLEYPNLRARKLKKDIIHIYHEATETMINPDDEPLINY